MAFMTEKQRNIDRISRNIRFHRHLYYNKQPRLKDTEFDALVEALRQLDPVHPALSEVGAPVDSSLGWPEIQHPVRMRSLANAMTIEDYKRWLQRSRVGAGKELVIEEKADGSAVELIYEEGEFVMGLTRGDGIVGADISPNIRKMKFFKQTLPERISCSIKGEIIMLKPDFDRLVTTLPKKSDGSDAFANPRNAATGISHRLDGQHSEFLSLVMYDIESRDINFSWETDKMQYISVNLGLVTTMYRLVSRDEVLEVRQQYMDNVRDSLKFQIDGLVIKVNDIQKCKQMGFMSNGDPQGHIAFKFDQRGVAAVVNNIQWKTGRTGKVTPLVWFDPVSYNGTKISKATLCNVDEVKRLGVKVGDTVHLIKAGEIIPKVTSVIQSSENSVSIPIDCASCGTRLTVVGADLHCGNEDCTGRNFKRLKHFIDILKKKNGLEDIGESLIERLIDAELVENFSDFFKLSVPDLMTLDRMGERSAQNIYANLQAAKNMTPKIFLTSLGIKHLGESTAASILEHYNLETIINGLAVTDLTSIEGIKDTAQAIIDGVAAARPIINELFESGVTVTQDVAPAEPSSEKLSGKSFEISGAFAKINDSTGKPWTRDEAYALIKSNGGAIKSISKTSGPDFFINMRGFGSKTARAESLGIRVISEEDFWSMIA